MIGRDAPSTIKFLILMGLLLASFSSAGRAEVTNYPSRVVSINLCTDELAILLAKPGQLVSVTTLIKDPLLSRYWRSAKQIKSHNQSLEQIMSFKPDLILASQFTSTAITRRLMQLGFRVDILPAANSISDVKKNISYMGGLLGSDAKAQRIIGTIESKIKKFNLRKESTKSTPLNIMVYYAGGWSRSGKSLTSELISLAGMINLTRAKGYKGWHSVGVEQLVRWNPDLLVVIQNDTRFQSMAIELLQHPAIQYFKKQNRLVSIPTQWVSCGSPSIVKTLERLSYFKQQMQLPRP